MTAPSLAAVLRHLEALLPLEHAAAWDNVGLLLEPPVAESAARPVRAILLTIDLTEPVLDEALGAGADLIVAYHPPIFAGLRSLTLADPRQRTLLRAIHRGVAVYSPHTAGDAAPGGVTDWLASGLGPLATSAPIEPARGPSGPLPDTGAGRTVTLGTPTSLDVIVERIKHHLGLERVRVAASSRHRAGAPIERCAVCPGSGGSLFEALTGIDLYLTGELRHHDVLAKVEAGSSVLLTDHTNCERGYLPVLAARLSERLGDVVSIGVARSDRDPLSVT